MKSLWIAFRASVVLMLFCGLLYPLTMTGLAQAMFPKQAEGSLIEENGQVVGSELIAQGFASPQLFHPRASASKYDPTASAATQAAVASEDYVKGLHEKVDALKQENSKLDPSDIPADLVTTSGSGFDPDLSPEAAKAQVQRIAQATGLSEAELTKLVDDHTKNRQLGVFGEPRVNVLELNRDLLTKIKR
jgi:K+-transporting ATPase ATPase C chain